jgi:tRNA A37 threonylcarbamoyladenosine synthetase subunit TsaC/SUA5/YrdC
MSTSPVPHIQSDARRVFETLKKGGIAIIPATVGYGIVAITPEALHRIFITKQRQPHKRHAMIGSYALHQALHVLPSREAEMVRLLTVDLDLPLGVVASFRADHPIIQKLPPDTLAQSTLDGKLAMLVNGGVFQDELSRMTADEELPLMGSSANLTGKGTKRTVEGIEPEILAVADIIIDYGRQKFHYPRPSSTMVDFQNMRLLRYGACYDVVQDALWRFYSIRLPCDPGRGVLFSGHLEFHEN